MNKSARIYVAGHTRPRRVGHRAPSRRGRVREHRHPGARGAGPDPAGGDGAVLRRGAAGVRVPRRGAGGRDPRERHLPGGFHPGQSPDPDPGHRRGVEERRGEAAVPRLVVHLSQAGPAADAGGRAAHRPPRADQRRVRPGEDRRDQDVPVVPETARVQRDLPHADQPVRAGGQLPSGKIPRAPRADPEVPRGEGRAGAAASRCGGPGHRGGSSCTWTTSRMPRCT